MGCKKWFIWYKEHKKYWLIVTYQVIDGEPKAVFKTRAAARLEANRRAKRFELPRRRYRVLPSGKKPS